MTGLLGWDAAITHTVVSKSIGETFEFFLLIDSNIDSQGLLSRLGILGHNKNWIVMSRIVFFQILSLIFVLEIFVLIRYDFDEFVFYY